MSDLADKKCIPCEGGTPPLTPDVVQNLLSKISSWNLVGGTSIKKDFKFKNFKEALAFVNKVGDIAEQEGHHPDINLHNWNKVTITLSTHSIEGLSENDFILAAKIDRVE